MSTAPGSSPRDRRRTWIAGGAVAAVLLMLGISFAAVPLYRLFCATTGYGGTTQVVEKASTLRGKRHLTVRFDANVGNGLAWRFAPETGQIKVRTGETATVFFKATNLTDHEIAAQALYNVTPDVAGAYFDKISCFCFSEQRLGPHESADMPVVFFLDPKLEKDATMDGIESLTLSYTFYPAKDVSAKTGETTKPAL